MEGTACQTEGEEEGEGDDDQEDRGGGLQPLAQSPAQGRPEEPEVVRGCLGETDPIMVFLMIRVRHMKIACFSNYCRLFC